MWKYLLFFYIISSVSCIQKAEISGNITWNDFLTKTKYVSEEFIRKLEPYILEHYPFENVNEKCTRSLLRFINGLKKWEPWAVRMADANGKFPSGFLSGTKMDFGSYDECLDLRVVSNKESEHFKGQFCMTTFESHLFINPERLTPEGRTYKDAYGTPPEWIGIEMEKMGDFHNHFGLHLGICTPSKCSQQDLYTIIDAIAKPMELKVTLQDCHTDEPRKLPIYVAFIIFVLMCWLGILLLGTVVDVIQRYSNNGQIELQSGSVVYKMLKAFSLYNNTLQLLDTRGSDGPLGFLFGVRFILCLWVICGHVLFFEDYWKYNRYTNGNRFIKLQTLDTLILDCGSLSVDAFLAISGFLMIYNSSKKPENLKVKAGFIRRFSKKYFRLISPVIFLILFTFLTPYVYNGPIWNTTIDYEVEKCYNNGWSNLIFLQNLYASREMCWVHTWYIATAMQIQIASYLNLALIRRHFKIGVAVGLLAVFGCYTNVATLLYENEISSFSIVMLKSPDIIHQIVTTIYTKPFYHFPPYVVGMVTGYIAKYHKGPLPQMLHVFGWASVILILHYIMYIQWIEIPFGYLSIFIIATRNTIWSTCCAWVLFACTNSKGVLNKVLSWKPFVPLGKLSYGVYIYHVLLLTVRYASIRERIFMGKISMVVDCLALSVSSFLLAFIAFIAIETPCSVMCDIWEGKVPSTVTKMSVRSENIEMINEEPNFQSVSKKEM